MPPYAVHKPSADAFQTDSDTQPHGKGKFQFDGAVFEGEYIYQKHGTGIYQWEDGRKYEG